MKKAHPTIRSIQVGRPADISADTGGSDKTAGSGRSWRTALFKDPVSGPVMLNHLNLEGDAQADLRHHGGLDKAVCVYPSTRYGYWEQRLDENLPNGAFGENLSVSGQDESDVCLGDVFQVGDAIVQVTQPRSPCWKVARRWHKSLALWIQETGYTGWYLRVVKPGHVEAGQHVELIERQSERWTIERLNRIRYHEAASPSELAALVQCEALSEGWRTRFEAALEGATHGDDQRRLDGPESSS